jgi:hypothetical protein
VALWPQQPPTVLKFNLRFHDSTQKKLFSEHQNKPKFNNLDDSEVLSSDSPGLKALTASLTSSAPTTYVIGINNPYSLILSKNFLILMVGSSVTPKKPHNTGPFL